MRKYSLAISATIALLLMGCSLTVIKTEKKEKSIKIEVKPLEIKKQLKK